MPRARSMWIALAVVGLLAAVLLALQLLRAADRRHDDRAWTVLARTQGPTVPFDPATVADLPDPARRYFLWAIAPGTPLSTVAEIEMDGELSLGTKEKPNYMPMRARQILAGRHGFVWRLQAGSGAMRFSGSDGYAAGEGWTRFWLLSLFPIVRAGGDPDFARSAAGRSIAESVFWVPAAMLPGEAVSWEAVDADTARAVVTHDGFKHLVDLTVAPDGRPLAVLIQRWTRENPEREWRLQPFGGTIVETTQAGGYRVASRVDGGNWFGTPAYFPFYRARVLSIRLGRER